MIVQNVLRLIGNTPLVRLDRISDNKVNIYGKLEFMLPGGSVKDRSAYQVIQDAYQSKRLKEGQWVVEMTSGNMGAGLALVCKQFGNPFIAVMPKGNSPERIKIIRSLGAEVILTDQVNGFQGQVTGKDIAYAMKVAEDYAADHKGFYVDQFNNPSSLKAHFETTGPEIWNDLPDLDAFVASIGTGGTFLGISKFLKSINSKIKCIAVEPENAAILKTGEIKNPKHIIQGTGYGLIPPHWDQSLADEIITVADPEVEQMTKKLCFEQGLYVGYSSGANVMAAVKYARAHVKAKNIVTILCDTGYKYSNL
ncbi:MAG: cysteine synthase family protein [Candidatus Atribacteria bacterium]|nr:cysteine synthase family protein [Candidatus Atribacteria bacterium]